MVASELSEQESMTTFDRMLLEIAAAPSVKPIDRGHVAAGTVVDGSYRIVRRVGSGGMGVVYLADDLDLDRPVAIKFKLNDASVTLLERMWREARMMARLSHPNVVSVYEVGTYRGLMFIAMEYLDRGTARDWLSAEDRTWSEIVGLFAQAGRGLAAAHAVGVVHRDFKPDNVLIASDGSVRVADFGLAHPLGGADLPSEANVERSDQDEASRDRLTQTGAAVGTPAYMAPEQWRCESVGDSADQFAFCVALFEALYGQRPFAGSSVEAQLESVATGTLEVRSTRRVPAWVLRVLRRGLALEPAQRYPSMDALVDALEHDPARRRTGVLLAAGAAATGALVGVASYGASVGPRCTDGREEIAAVWNERAAGEVRTSFAGNSLPLSEQTLPRVLEALDAYATNWASEHQEACEATHVRGKQSTLLLDRRMACLDRRRAALGAAIDVLSDADDTVVENAIDIANGLPSLQPCGNASALEAEVEPPPPESEQEVDVIRGALDRARTQTNAGQLEAAKQNADAAAQRAEALGYLPLVAEALATAAAARSAYGDGPGALDAARRGYFAAIEAGQDRVAMEIALRVPEVSPALEQALTWCGSAEALAKRLGQEADTKAELAIARGDAYRVASDFDAARREFELAIDSASDPLESAAARRRLAAVLANQGRIKEALTVGQPVLGALQDAYGEDHWRVAFALVELAPIAARSGQSQRASEMIEQAIEIHRTSAGENSPRLVQTLNVAGSIALEHGDVELAVARFEQALEQHKRVSAGQPARPITVLVNLASARGHQGHNERAIELSKEALALSQRHYGEEHLNTASVHANLAAYYGRLGRHEEALREIERATAVYQKVLGPSDKTLLSLLNLRSLHHGMGNNVEAWDALRRAEEVARIVHPQEHLNHARLAAARGGMLRDEGKHREAASALARCAEITERVRGRHHHQRVLCLGWRGKALADAGEDPWPAFNEAAAAIEQGAEVEPVFVAGLYAYMAEESLKSDRARARAYAERGRDIALTVDEENINRADVWARLQRVLGSG